MCFVLWGRLEIRLMERRYETEYSSYLVRFQTTFLLRYHEAYYVTKCIYTVNLVWRCQRASFAPEIKELSEET
jgi:hypothetical protein